MYNRPFYNNTQPNAQLTTMIIEINNENFEIIKENNNTKNEKQNIQDFKNKSTAHESKIMYDVEPRVVQKNQKVMSNKNRFEIIKKQKPNNLLKTREQKINNLKIQKVVYGESNIQNQTKKLKNQPLIIKNNNLKKKKIVILKKKQKTERLKQQQDNDDDELLNENLKKKITNQTKQMWSLNATIIKQNEILKNQEKIIQIEIEKNNQNEQANLHALYVMLKKQYDAAASKKNKIKIINCDDDETTNQTQIQNLTKIRDFNRATIENCGIKIQNERKKLVAVNETIKKQNQKLKKQEQIIHDLKKQNKNHKKQINFLQNQKSYALKIQNQLQGKNLVFQKIIEYLQNQNTCESIIQNQMREEDFVFQKIIHDLEKVKNH